MLITVTCALIQSRRLTLACDLSLESCLVIRQGRTGTLANNGNICLNLNQLKQHKKTKQKPADIFAIFIGNNYQCT